MFQFEVGETAVWAGQVKCVIQTRENTKLHGNCYTISNRGMGGGCSVHDTKVSEEQLTKYTG